ncbi:MAG: replication-associated recombination protein A, partial [Proteobacteria bacterium]|nr:replication-associated recombination protein A [Pseudomonadota bacterium]
SGQDYFPDGMTREVYYEPRKRGFEREIAKRLEYWNRLRAEKTSSPEDEPPPGRTDRGKKDGP